MYPLSKKKSLEQHGSIHLRCLPIAKLYIAPNSRVFDSCRPGFEISWICGASTLQVGLTSPESPDQRRHFIFIDTY